MDALLGACHPATSTALLHIDSSGWGCQGCHLHVGRYRRIAARRTWAGNKILWMGMEAACKDKEAAIPPHHTIPSTDRGNLLFPQVSSWISAERWPFPLLLTKPMSYAPKFKSHLPILPLAPDHSPQEALSAILAKKGTSQKEPIQGPQQSTQDRLLAVKPRNDSKVRKEKK